ncbi:MAG: DUF4340 domain-containing protein [Akkermansia sp.]|nr:DUF4340 domain-containing protein [Akkermansia sp.]
MRILSTVLLTLAALLSVTAAVFLTIDGNLARLTGWYSFKPGMPLFTAENTNRLSTVNWIRIRDLHDQIECEKEKDGTWWITKPFRDRLNPVAASTILNFTENARVVDTLPLDRTTRGRLREYGVQSNPHTITIKAPQGDSSDSLTTIARYTLGSTSPWLADTGDGQSVMPTTYLRTDYYGKDKRIHVVSGNILHLFKEGLSALRDPRPLLFAPDDLRELRITGAGSDSQPVSLCRVSAEAAWNIVSPVITAADQDKINNLVASFANLSAVKVEDAGAVTIKEPLKYTVEFKLNGHAEPIVLKIYDSYASPADGQPLCHAEVNNRPVVFTLQAEPRVNRKGSYSRIVNSICNLPVLPTKVLAQLKSGGGNIYTNDLPLSLAELRSLKFTDIVDKDVERAVLTAHDSDASLKLLLIPGDIESEVSDIWMYSVGKTAFAEAEELVVRRFLNGLGSIPVRGVEADLQPGEDPKAFVARYGLDKPYYSLYIRPKSCMYRATLFGVDLPLVKDRDARIFYISRYRDPATGKSKWVGMEMGGNTIYWLSTRLTRTFALNPNNWRARNLVRFPLSALRTLRLGYQQAPLVLHYDYIGETWSGQLADEDVTPRINPHRAEYYVRQLQKLKVSEWLDSDDEYALESLKNPVFTVSLELELTDFSDAEAIVMDSAALDHDELLPVMGDSRLDKAEEALTESTETDRALRDMALQERKTQAKTITIELAPSTEASDKPFFYGRIRETGELFVLPFNDAQGLAGSILDM